MNWLSKLTFLGSGISRNVYLLKNGKVLKVPNSSGDYASINEIEVFNMIPKNLQKFFPSPKILKRNYILCDYVETADSILYQNEIYELDGFSIRWFVEKFTNSDYKEVEELLGCLIELDILINEILEIPENFGVKNGEFCLIDWGEKK